VRAWLSRQGFSAQPVTIHTVDNPNLDPTTLAGGELTTPIGTFLLGERYAREDPEFSYFHPFTVVKDNNLTHPFTLYRGATGHLILARDWQHKGRFHYVIQPGKATMPSAITALPEKLCREYIF
jgi:hypothetical protein